MIWAPPVRRTRGLRRVRGGFSAGSEPCTVRQQLARTSVCRQGFALGEEGEKGRRRNFLQPSSCGVPEDPFVGKGGRGHGALNVGSGNSQSKEINGESRGNTAPRCCGSMKAMKKSISHKALRRFCLAPL